MPDIPQDVLDALASGTPIVLDLFAGPGGWSVAAKNLGLTEVGVEFEKNACKTRRAAKHLTIECSVTDLDLALFKGKVVGLIASPPCQAFSVAGNGKGLSDPRGQLVTEVMRYVKELNPEWVACEQVTPVLKIWKEYAKELRALGYTAWCGNLNAADYGVPQTRKRAVLLASKTRQVSAPTPTHNVDGANGLPKWVTMAQALQWEKPDPEDQLVPGKYAKVSYGNRRLYTVDEPAPTIAFGNDSASWVWERPATTVVASFSPETIAGPGFRKAGDGPRQNAPGSVRVSVAQAGVLQSFPHDYPWQGAKTRQYQQVGNAIPVGLAQAALNEVLNAPLLYPTTPLGDASDQ